MNPADIYFYHKLQSKEEILSLEYEIWEFISNLTWHGHIYEELILSKTSNFMRFTVNLASKDALNEEYFTEQGLKLKKALIDKRIDIKVDIFDENSCVTDLQNKKQLVFYNRWDWPYTPIADSESECVIPLFKLPISDKLVEKTISWDRTYKLFSNAFIDSHPSIEMKSYYELADLKSDLNQEGVELCEKIEKEIGLPIYYYLYRHWGYSHKVYTQRDIWSDAGQLKRS